VTYKNGGKRYVKRRKDGTFAKGRRPKVGGKGGSLSADSRTKAKTKLKKPGYGDQGDLERKKKSKKPKAKRKKAPPKKKKPKKKKGGQKRNKKR
jgi:hypothetical protein